MTDETKAPEADQKAPEAAVEAPREAEQDPTDLAARRDQQKAQEAEQGVLHDSGLLDKDAEGYIGAQTVADAAPEGVSTDAADGFVIAKGDDPAKYTKDRPATMDEQKAPRFDKAAPEYAKGYVGTLPNEGDREDLTNAAALKRAQADHGTGKDS